MSKLSRFSRSAKDLQRLVLDVGDMFDALQDNPLLRGTLVQVSVNVSGEYIVSGGSVNAPTGALVASQRCVDGNASPACSMSITSIGQGYITAYFTVTGAHLVTLWVW